MKRKAAIRIGCSGWQYRHWRGDFYPAGLPASQWLQYYAAHFDTVEINNSFYRLPEAETFAGWRTRVPSHFTYAVKASRYLTHMKKLKDAEPAVELLFSRADRLRKHLGPVLYQLPPHWARNLERLETFLQILPTNRLHAIEFRDPSWYDDTTFALLDKYHVALCLHDMVGSASERRTVGPFAYVRFHGPQRYSGGYTKTVLASWADWCVDCREKGRAFTRISTMMSAGTRPGMPSRCASSANRWSVASARGGHDNRSGRYATLQLRFQLERIACRNVERDRRTTEECHAPASHDSAQLEVR